MTEDEWLTSDDALPLLVHLQKRGDLDERKMRLLVLALCRKVWDLLDEDCRAAVETGERCVEGELDDSAVDSAWKKLQSPDILEREASGFRWANAQCNAARAVCYALMPRREVDKSRFALGRGELVVKDRAVMVVSTYSSTVIALATLAAATSGYEPQDEREVKREIRTRLLAPFHDIVGNPFRPIALAPAGLTPEVKDLAAHIYDHRAFERVPELADTLDRAGCRAPELLAHCRSHTEHVRGCWVLDLVLGKS